VTDRQTDRQTDGRTDRQNSPRYVYRVCITCSAVKIKYNESMYCYALLLLFYKFAVFSDSLEVVSLLKHNKQQILLHILLVNLLLQKSTYN